MRPSLNKVEYIYLWPTELKHKLKSSYNVPCFLCRMGFSAEQLARWVAERTDVNVCRLCVYRNP